MDAPTLELLKSCVGIAGLPVVVIAVQQTKRAVPDWPGYAWPLCSIVWAVLINVIVALALSSDIYVAVVVGVITGILASNAYDKAGKEQAAPHG